MTHVLLVAIGVALAVFVLTMVGQLGRVMLERDPHSVWGERLTIVGIAARHSLRILATRSPLARAIAQSLPDSDPPPSADRTPIGPRTASRVVGCSRCYAPAALVGETIPADGLCASCRGPRKMPPPLPLLCLILLVAAGIATSPGCTDLDPAKSAANATREVGIAGAELLRTVCTEPYRAATTRAEVDRLDSLGCQHAANAYDGLRAAHTTLVAVLRTTEAGQCVGVSRSARECNVAGAYVDLSKAAAEWAAAISRIESGAK